MSISRILRKARGQYARAYLYTETDDNDATYFLLYQLRVLCRAIDDLKEYLHRKARELHDIERRVYRASLDGLNTRQLALIRHALTSQYTRYTVASHQRSHGISYETARSDLLRLVQLGLLRQSKQGKAFVFHPTEDIHQRIPTAR